METKKTYIERFLNEPVAVLCVRYKYRGIVSEVGEDFVVLSNAFAVISGDSATSETIQREDTVPSDLMISLDAIESICQPVWCFNGYDKAKIKLIKKEKSNGK